MASRPRIRCLDCDLALSGCEHARNAPYERIKLKDIVIGNESGANFDGKRRSFEPAPPETESPALQHAS